MSLPLTLSFGARIPAPLYGLLTTIWPCVNLTLCLQRLSGSNCGNRSVVLVFTGECLFRPPLPAVRGGVGRDRCLMLLRC